MSTRLPRALPPLLFLSVGCQVVLGFEDFSGDATTTTDGGAGAPTTATTGSTACDLGDVKGGAMVLVSGYTGGCLWIDATEVTRGQYQAFLDNSPDLKTQAGHCDWNESFEPDPECDHSRIQANSDPLSPIVCIDQCDAVEYCESVGKRLCEARWTNLNDQDVDEWYAACSSNGVNEYPYGSHYTTGACNDSTRPESGCDEMDSACTPIATDGLTACKTPDGAGDMAGNVAEWVGSCDRVHGETDQCYVHGGGVNDGPTSASCDGAVSRLRSFTHPALGFRCCAG